MSVRIVHAIWILSLTVWVGGMAILALFVAPLTFKALESREQAGAVFGTYLRAFRWVDLVCGCLCAALLLIRALTNPVDGWMKTQLILLGLMLILAGVHDLAIIPGASDARDDPARFQRLHRASVFVFGITLLTGAGLVAVTALKTP